MENHTTRRIDRDEFLSLFGQVSNQMKPDDKAGEESASGKCTECSALRAQLYMARIVLGSVLNTIDTPCEVGDTTNVRTVRLLVETVHNALGTIQ